MKTPASVSIVASVLAVVVVSGCAHSTSERTASIDSIGLEGETRLSGYMDAPSRPGQPTEETPGQVS